MHLLIRHLTPKRTNMQPGLPIAMVDRVAHCTCVALETIASNGLILKKVLKS